MFRRRRLPVMPDCLRVFQFGNANFMSDFSEASWCEGESPVIYFIAFFFNSIDSDIDVYQPVLSLQQFSCYF